MKKPDETPARPAAAKSPGAATIGARDATITLRGVRRGFLAMTPVAAFVIPLGMAFGVAAVDRGVTALQAILMSVFVFSGSAQFTMLQFWAEPLPVLPMALAVLAISARLGVLGAALSPWINRFGRGRRLSIMTMLSDPNFVDSLAAFRRGEADVGRLIGGGAALWSAWSVGTAIGAALGDSAGDLQRFGVEALMAAYFTAMIAEQWEGRAELFPSLAAAAAAAVLGFYFLPSGWNIILAAAAGGAVVMARHGR